MVAAWTSAERGSIPTTARANGTVWRSGDRLWVVEIVASFGGVMAKACFQQYAMLADLREKVFPAQPLRYLAASKDGQPEVRVM